MILRDIDTWPSPLVHQIPGLDPISYQMRRGTIQIVQMRNGRCFEFFSLNLLTEKHCLSTPPQINL